jgi:hypothetical protein
VLEPLALSAGFDNRRNVRLYRDVVTPETEFDDSYRQGLWGGLELEAAERYRVGFRAQESSGDSERSTSYTANASARRLGGVALGVGLRGTRYRSPRIDGWLCALDGDAQVTPWLGLGLGGGLRDERSSIEGVASRQVVWLSAEIEATLRRGLYTLLSVERSRSDAERYDQIYTSLTYRL